MLTAQSGDDRRGALEGSRRWGKYPPWNEYEHARARVNQWLCSPSFVLDVSLQFVLSTLEDHRAAAAAAEAAVKVTKWSWGALQVTPSEGMSERRSEGAHRVSDLELGERTPCPKQE